MSIVGITGKIGSGKDTIADYLCKEHGYVRMSFASTLKDAVSSVFGWDRNMLEGLTKESREWRETKDTWWSNRLNMEITPRFVLQYWGTEVCRQGFHNDIWVASLENKLRNISKNVVITDCRFKNEVDAIKNAGGVSIRVERGNEPEWYNFARQYNDTNDTITKELLKNELELMNVHASEYSSVGLDYDYVIDNNGTLEDLYRKVRLVINL